MGSLNLNSAPKGTAKRDALVSSEIAVQALWEREKAFESNPTYKEDGTSEDKFIVTFPYPYSNGHLHLGHAFSLTKAVFRAQFERNRGKNSLFPFAFHCTGMPIQAAANKLKSEITQYGIPPKFPEEDPAVRAQMEADLAAAAKAKAEKAAASGSKAKGGKTKLVQKTGTGIVRQWNILKRMVPEEEIPEFADPIHWLKYFPPIGVEHMKRFGSGVDWRRSFITTAVNGYYDAFIRWQFNVLREKGKVLFGKRNNVYSILDGQVCADHDRSEGEGVGPQEYVLIKLKVLEPDHGQARHGKMEALLKRVEDEGKKGVFMVPATLRPETMYGQTNCFVLPTGEYGAYYIDATDEVFIMSARSARGLSCQAYDAANDVYFTKEFGKIECLETFTGDELLGLPLKAPNATYEKVYTLPLLTISMGKGTGVVTSVPSDAPDDYVALKALQDKPDFAAKYDITPDMVDPFEVVPIISIEGYGDASAVFMCEKLGITSPNDKAKLAQAKDETYLKGFTMGVMNVGPHAGKKVSEAKPIIKDEMITAGQAHLYFEPESKVVSRTNDECVVASTDQWYLAYGEDSWCSAVKNHVLDSEKFNAYDATALEKYDATLDWLKEWACTRQFGLGTQLPWDQHWVIESLSDSTIYMSYYTIAHYLQGENNLNGDESKSPENIKVEDLTDDVFNFIYRKGFSVPENCCISAETLEKMRAEFRYWYPMDLRVSAKDLIPNHLTMALYNHAAMWDDEPELWPRGYYTNGHIMVDAEKMSKSKGNFLMMLETIENYSADATRFACADAGDTLDDANFSRDTANTAIVSLSNEAAWIKEVLLDTDKSTLRSGDELNFMDKVFENETNRLINETERCFETMQFREGLQKGWFEMMIARNEYRSWCQDSGVPLHEGLVRKWAESLIIIICPICPHWSETLWKDLGKEGLAVRALWPVVGEEDKLLTRQSKFLRDSLKNFRAQAGKAKKGWKIATILVAEDYPQWKVDALLWMQSKYDKATGSFPDTFMTDLKDWSTTNVTDKKQVKFTMQFVSFTKKEVEDVGETGMDTKCPFDQLAILKESKGYLQSQLGMEEIGIGSVDDPELAVPEKNAQNVSPGKPYLWIR
ncbi:probable isoleucine-trna synthetase [Thalassiosira pseudonana CCMP1335]|uniref:leucine--tRNA ligase n=1 Tax=Thalassiosira pseudonana TaxID=35128 RepID=B8BYD7_THAPS|nr:probable isoleucine-trna synthetase [Thalassiosira pseudonana CCMP1335]EED94357.1 probable isoleucine-trna synthetase [Thalassiosira pseudonana CCMP1335]